MNCCESIGGISLFCCSISVAIAEAEFSEIDEKILLNPPQAGETTDKVIIYSRVRNTTIHKAMDSQFHRIENMMFVNTIVEPEADISYADDDDCD